MSVRQMKKYASMSGVATGALATMDMPIGGTHYAYFLRCLNSSNAEVTVAQMKAELDTVRILIDGETALDATATLLLELQQYYYAFRNGANVDGIIPINWSRDFLPSVLGANTSALQGDVFALGNRNIQNITIEVKCGTLTNIAKIEVFAQRVDAPTDLGQFVRLQNFPQNFATTGTNVVDGIPKEIRTAHLAYHIKHATGTLDQATVIVNGTDRLKLPAKLNQVISEKAGRDPQSGITTLAFDLQNNLAGFLPMVDVQDLRLELEWSGAAPNNYNIFREAIFNFGQA